MYGEDLITDRMAQKWFSRLSGWGWGQFELTDLPTSDRPVQLDENQMTSPIKGE